MIEGIIYRYISSSGKSYIGQTINEPLRRRNWYSDKYHYAGSKIDRARKKYGKNSFRYEVLVRNKYSSKELAIADLNRLEIYYIGIYDSYNNGYNCTIGGDGVCGFEMTKEQRNALRLANLGKRMSEESKRKIGIASKARQNLPENKLRMSLQTRGRKNPRAIEAMTKAKEKAVVQLSLSGEFIREFNSIKDAYIFLGKRGNITSVCLGRRKQAFGYKWLYKEDYVNI